MLLRAYVILAIFYTSCESNDIGLHVPKELSWQDADIFRQDLVLELFRMTEKHHVLRDHNVVFPPFFWKKKKGVYGSDIKLNFHGDPGLAGLRSVFRVFDNNMFATSWITTCLIEAYEYGNAPRPSDDAVSLSVQAISGFHDNNFNEQPNMIMTFWPEVYNGTSTTWQSTPENLLSLFKETDYLPWNIIEKILNLAGFSEEVKYIKEFLNEREIFKKAFEIPADFDDTFVNLGLGSLLYEYQNDFPIAQRLWQDSNQNAESLWTALKKFAYRPFSGDRDVNTIDPRSYYYLRGYLEEAKKAGHDVALIPTWVQNLAGNRNMSQRGVAMPFNVNNVDVTVCANAIYGLTASVVSGLLNETALSDPDIKKIYLNTSSMLVWEIQNNLAGRKDLALTYYPSLFEFYWFMSRTFALLQRHVHQIDNGSLPEIFEDVRQNFGFVLKDHVTYVIVNESQEAGSDKVYYDDFLGDGDFTFEGKPLIRGEDRIFTTSMAVNTLVNTWSVFNYTTRQLQWIEDVPSIVIELVEKASLWLSDNALSGEYKPWNAFFSGSGKGYGSMPFWYPINRLEYLNGTKIPLNSTVFSPDVMLGMEGFIPEEEYQALLNETHFGRRTPTKFRGYNYGNDSFPFWSSEAYTYVTSMLALAQTNSLMSV